MSLRNKALDLLARREHSEYELAKKLRERGFADDDIARVLADLTAESLLSDERFAESYVRHRANKGFGPLRILQELRERGISDHLASSAVYHQDFDWHSRAKVAQLKKFGQLTAEDYQQRCKQMKFLQYRGFTAEYLHADDGD